MLTNWEGKQNSLRGFITTMHNSVEPMSVRKKLQELIIEDIISIYNTKTCFLYISIELMERKISAISDLNTIKNIN